MKKTHYILTALLVLMALTSCQHNQVYRIGVSQCSNDDWRRKMNEEIEREVLFHNNVEVEILSADDNNEKQIADITYFVQNGFDLIIAAPNEADALTPIIKKVYDSGIPVILFDRNIHGDSYTAFQGADNLAIGVQAARMAYALAGDTARVIEILGLEGSTPAAERKKGFHQEAERVHFSILGSSNGNWNTEEGARAAEKLLNEHPNANVIYAHNDRMAIAASETARRMGRHHIKIIGIDAAPNIGIQAVNDSIIDTTFLYPTEGHQLIRTALAILEGRPYERTLILPTPAAVDRSNAEILLLQDRALREETDKMGELKRSIDKYWQEHNQQTYIMYGLFIILFLLLVVVYQLIRAYRSHVKHRRQMEERNAELAKSRDEQADLYRQLQEAMDSKVAFFTNVSHDLRTPLTLIADPVQQLVEASNLDSQQRTLMQLAHKNVRILHRLINQILDWQKFDNGRLALNLTRIQLDKVLREWTASFEQVAKKQHIRFQTHIEESNYTTAIDVEKIERVLFNLLSNAFKFTPENGKITVELRRDNAVLVLTVSDTGRGINTEEIKHVFERFYKTDKVNPTGSGIGLALSQVFVEMHRGHISVDSEPGKGTTFTVLLPFIEANEQPETLSATQNLAIQPEELVELTLIENDNPIEINENAPTLLVIDDNPDICTLIRNIMSGQYTLLQASNGAQGIRLASKYIPDLIICDVMMPGMNGYNTCQALKSEVITSHIPVLLLTACSQDEQRIEAYACGADAYMSKPFDSRMLTTRCESLIQNRKRIYEGQGLQKAESRKQKTEDKPATKSTTATNDIDSEFYQRFTAIVEAEMTNSELSVEHIAERIGMSRVQMYRKLKALTNYSPAELLRNIRLRRADRLLKTTEKSVSEIGYAVGFSSPSYFAKCYKDFFGEAPSDVQSRTSKNN